MNINRTNYENYFLLYVDGELSTTEMQAVDRFAAENVDLQTELEILLDTKLIPEQSGHLLDKSLLYRSTDNKINEFNYEEQFLLFIDNELSTEATAQTIQFVAAHPELTQSLDILKQTILPAENIVFPNKSSLFRKEDKKPIVIGWRRMAVAAAMIGLIFFVWNLIPYTENNSSVAKVKPIQSSDLKQEGINKTRIENNSTEQNVAFAKQQQTKTIAPYNKNKSALDLKTEHAAISENEMIAMNDAPKRITDSENSAEKMPKTNTETFTNTNNASLATNDHANEIINAPTNTETDNDQPIFKQAVLKELDTDDENKSLYVAGLELNRDKLRGIFRKASSIFKNKGKEEDKYESSVTPRTLK